MMGTLYLDPNAQAYTDDEIVGKVNAAAANITRANCVEGAALAADLDDIDEGATNKHFTTTKDAKLTGIEDNATADQTGDEMVTAIDAGTASITRETALSQDDLKLVKSDPASGQRQVRKLNLGADNKVEVDFNDTPEP
jgi:hypothetical protein